MIIIKNKSIMEKGVEKILAKHGCLYMKDDYKALFEDLEAYYKPTETVNQQSEHLKILVGTDEDIVLPDGYCGRLLKHIEESFLVEMNHNGRVQYFTASQIKIKKKMSDFIIWWDNLTPTEKQQKTNKHYCKFKQVFWKDVPNQDIRRMFKDLN